jgi:hypothetical protein
MRRECTLGIVLKGCSQCTSEFSRKAESRMPFERNIWNNIMRLFLPLFCPERSRMRSFLYYATRGLAKSACRFSYFLSGDFTGIFLREVLSQQSLAASQVRGKEKSLRLGPDPLAGSARASKTSPASALPVTNHKCRPALPRLLPAPECGILRQEAETSNPRITSETEAPPDLAPDTVPAHSIQQTQDCGQFPGLMTGQGNAPSLGFAGNMCNCINPPIAQRSPIISAIAAIHRLPRDRQ